MKKYQKKKFTGVAIWENSSTAKKRIDELKLQLESNILKLNMFETFLISKKFGEFIVLENSGIFYVSRKHIEQFINELIFDIDLIKELDKYVEDNLNDVNYEIDIKTLFYVMKNSDSLGLQNISDEMQMFNFSSNEQKANDVVSDIAIFKVKENMSEINIIKENQSEEKKDQGIQLATNQKITIAENGNTLIHYADNLIIEKKDPWTIADVIIDGIGSEERLNPQQDQNKNKFDFNKIKNDMAATKI